MKNIIIGLIAISILGSCTSSETSSKKSKESYIALIDSLEGVRKGYFENNQLPPKTSALESVQAYEFFVADYPEDEKAAEYLFESAKRYEIDLLDYNNAIRLYKEVYDKYPKYEHHKMALFHIGNAYHSSGDSEKAKEHFNDFKTKYPDHDFADDAEGMINIIDMGGEEEFLRRIMEQSGKDSTES